MRATVLASPRYIAMLILISTSLNCALTQQSSAADDEPQSVEVTAVRDPDILPYKIAYETIKKIRDASKDRVQILFRITAAKSHLPLHDLNIYLDGPATHEKVEISPSGFVNVPLSQAAYADGAEFVTNKKKGSLNVSIFLIPKFPAAEIKYADIADTVQAARAAIKEIVPWYWRLFMPSIHGIGICYPTQDQTVLIRGNEEVSRAANSDDTDMLKSKVYCAKFPEKEASLAKENLIVPPDGWQAIFQ